MFQLQRLVVVKELVVIHSTDFIEAGLAVAFH